MSQNKNDGGLWEQVSAKTGVTYLSGSIEINGQKHNFVALKNTYKEEGSKKPDYIIKLKEKAENEQSPF